jgi:hypothetical protein
MQLRWQIFMKGTEYIEACFVLDTLFLSSLHLSEGLYAS